MIPSKIEVLVDLGPKPDLEIVNKTLNELKTQDQVKEAIFKDGAILVETTLPSSKVVDMVKKVSGKRVVLQGFGETVSAVAMVTSQACCQSNVMGVIRFQQTEGGALLADGSIDGLGPGPHGLHVRASGDLSQGCLSLGNHYDPRGAPHGGPEDPPERRHAGDLGNIIADENGRAVFRIIDSVLKVDDIIGRSVAVTENRDDLGKGSAPTSSIDGGSGKPVACGIIARAAGVFQNPKRICLCDGVVVWDEKDRPLAGKGRQKRCCESKGSSDTSQSSHETCCENGKMRNRKNTNGTKPLSIFDISLKDLHDYKEIVNMGSEKNKLKKARWFWRLWRKDKKKVRKLRELYKIKQKLTTRFSSLLTLLLLTAGCFVIFKFITGHLYIIHTFSLYTYFYFTLQQAQATSPGHVLENHFIYLHPCHNLQIKNSKVNIY